PAVARVHRPSPARTQPRPVAEPHPGPGRRRLRPLHRPAGEPPAATAGRWRPRTGLHQDGAQRGLRLQPAGRPGGRGRMTPPRHAPRRWLPRTLRARLLLILGAGLLLAHALSFALLFGERMDATRSMMLRNLYEDVPVS